MRAATFFDGEEWRQGVVTLDAAGAPVLRDEPPSPDLAPLAGRVIGGFTDHHVHLQLVDATALRSSLLGRVVDLGGNIAEVSRLAGLHNSGRNGPGPSAAGENAPSDGARPELRRRATPRAPDIEFAGAFLTAPGGYPSDRDWAPPGSFRAVASADDAAAAVTEMADAGATRIKVASNSHAGPVFDDDLFRTLVDLAADRGLPTVVHAEGRGQAQRAARLGATQLAHAPFTERLTDDEIAAQAGAVSWISTLAIHGGADLRIAIDNVRRFHAAGGTVLYGTDMGNGPTPVDLNPQEIAALRETGVGDTDLLRALHPVDPRNLRSALLLLPPASVDPLRARRLTADDLKV